MSPTRRELVSATRTRIIDAAARLLRERGANSFSMDVLAKEAGVARATVYEHFRSKRVVLDELASSTSRSLALAPQGSRVGDPLTALRGLLGAVCRHWTEHETTVRELRSLAAATGTDTRPEAVDAEYLRCIVGGLSAAGHLRTHWSTDDAVDALALLTSFATYEQLRGPALRNAAQIEAVLAKLAVAIVAPNAG
ncbi:MAG: TetR/AcrR family transcriptional regulator [Acidimicrobiia bacterium]